MNERTLRNNGYTLKVRVNRERPLCKPAVAAVLSPFCSGAGRFDSRVRTETGAWKRTIVKWRKNSGKGFFRKEALHGELPQRFDPQASIDHGG
jgi:hypothetical protein